MWETTDISLAGYLALTLTVMPEFRWEGDSCWFVFHRSNALQRKTNQFYNNDGVVEPQSFMKKVGEIKKAMFKARRATELARR